MTVRDLIKKSLVLIGAVSPGENISAQEASDGLSSLNDLLDSWSTDGLLIPTTTIEEFTLVPGQGSYTIGPSGNFNTVNPQVIEEARLKDVSGTPIELPIKVLSTQEWADVIQKTVTSSQPDSLYFQRSGALSTIYLYPVPSAANKLVLYSKKTLGSFASANDVISLPPGYQRALRYNLALELAVEYGKQPSEYVFQTSQELKAQLMRVNDGGNPVLLKSDILGIVQDSTKPFNIYTGS